MYGKRKTGKGKQRKLNQFQLKRKGIFIKKGFVDKKVSKYIFLLEI